MKWSPFVVIYLLLAGPHAARGGTPVPTQATAAIVIIHLLDADSRPVVGVIVHLVLNCYNDTIEEIPFGDCITDTTGLCSIMVTDPPRLRSGRIEGFIELTDYGRQLIGWKGEDLEITLQLLPDGKLATASTPLDQPYEGQAEQPTDAPLSTKTPLLTSSPASTSSPVTPTGSGIPPTPTTTFTATSTLIPRLAITDTSNPPTLLPSSGQVKRSGWIWFGLGLVVFAAMDAALVIIYFRQRKPK